MKDTADTLDNVSLPAQKQLEAYNSKDIVAFMPWWKDDCQYYAFPDTLLANGSAEIMARHIERFKEPDLFGTLLSRIVVGNIVIDHETVTRSFPEGKGEIDVICIYEIEDTKIAKAWFKTSEPRMFSPTE